jgi:hypothetical protein
MPRLPGWLRAPSIRASTTRWISEVPEYIVLATASRRSRSIPRSAGPSSRSCCSPRAPASLRRRGRLTARLARADPDPRRRLAARQPPGVGDVLLGPLEKVGNRQALDPEPGTPRHASRGNSAASSRLARSWLSSRRAKAAAASVSSRCSALSEKSTPYPFPQGWPPGQLWLTPAMAPRAGIWRLWPPPTCQPGAGQARRHGLSVASRRTTSIAPESR